MVPSQAWRQGQHKKAPRGLHPPGGLRLVSEPMTSATGPRRGYSKS
jgi:hypothetical protein